jgi:chromosome partitioning protein
MKVIAIASRKGGSGKTTLAGHLAVQAERAGDGPVALVDVDPQGSLADWWNKRTAPTPLFMQTTLADLADNIARLRDMETKLLIIDTPPALTATIGDIIRLSDLVVIPTRPSPHDLRSIGATAELVEHLGKPLVFVLNAATPRARITNEAVTILSRHGLLAPVIVHQRVDFASSMIDGRTVMELSGGTRSAAEISKLWTYLASRIDGNVQLSILPAMPTLSAADKVFAVAGASGGRQNIR